MSNMEPTTIKIFLLDGDSDGVRAAQIDMSTIKAIAFPKGQFSRVKAKFPEIHNPGVYLLLGRDLNENNYKVAYIGESENVAKRLQFYISDKKSKDKQEFWIDTITLVSKDDNLNKSHTRHVEAKLIELAHGNINWKITNDQNPQKAGKLSESEEYAMKKFIEQAKILTAALGWDLFKPNTGTLTSKNENITLDETPDSPEFYFLGTGFSATAIIHSTTGDWIVKENSEAKLEPSGKIPNSAKKLRDQLIAAGKLVELDGRLVFKEDCLFPTASAAANVICGRAANGRVEWKLAGGMDYAVWEAKQSEEVADSAMEYEQILLSQEIGSVPRVLDSINCFRRKFGVWPTRLLLDKDMAEAIQQDNLTFAGWQALAKKLEVKYSVVGTVIAEDEAGNSFEYDSSCFFPEDKEHRADNWIWGCEVWPKS
ncbi:MAG: GIY-YIG nuclease family protein [Methylotenera sp.]|nr:GIY-YIG nuclease family protein [Methylotenera sp.]MDD4925721.1 GIY-YIG nuclease family protein [Methylotenera sp.]